MDPQSPSLGFLVMVVTGLLRMTIDRFSENRFFSDNAVFLLPLKAQQQREAVTREPQIPDEGCKEEDRIVHTYMYMWKRQHSHREIGICRYQGYGSRIVVVLSAYRTAVPFLSLSLTHSLTLSLAHYCLFSFCAYSPLLLLVLRDIEPLE